MMKLLQKIVNWQILRDRHRMLLTQKRYLIVDFDIIAMVLCEI